VSSLEKIQQPIAHEMEAFEDFFKSAMQSENMLLDKITHYIIKRKGKQMRPMFVFLASKVCGNVSPATYTAASLIELLHTATLVHDDVVDVANTRRGFFSINALWKNKIAVLVGDYLLSKGLLLSLENKDFTILTILSNAVKNMSEGELLQMEKTRNLNFDESVYYEIINGKTASLLASSCAAGASSVSNDSAVIEQMRAFGENVGMAFQIKDDLFDYGEAKVGKPTGNDIKEKKLTLPLIHILQKVTPALKKQIIYIVKNNNNDKAKVKFVIDNVVSNGGIEYATDKMIEYRDKALTILHSFPKSSCRDALEELVRYTTDRKF